MATRKTPFLLLGITFCIEFYGLIHYPIQDGDKYEPIDTYGIIEDKYGV